MLSLLSGHDHHTTNFSYLAYILLGHHLKKLLYLVSYVGKVSICQLRVVRAYPNFCFTLCTLSNY